MVSDVPGLSRLPAAIAIAAALLLGLPAAASAADTYADANAPDNNGDCLTPATACQTIGGDDGALSKSGSGDTTFVADGAYAESVVLDGGRSLVSLDDTDPKPVIDSGGTTTITVDSSGAGTVSGLQVLSSYSAIEVNGTVTIEDNAFDENPTFDRPVVAVESGSSVVIRNNVFVDPDATGYSIGVFLSTSDLPAAVVSDNTFDGLGLGVIAVGGDAQISGNQFSGMHPLPSSGLPGAGILVGSGQPMIEHNTIGAPFEDPSAGILVLRQGPGNPSVGATLRRNRVSGSDVGVQVTDADLPVTLSNDLIYDNTIGLESTDSSADTPVQSTQGDVSATNATIVDNGTDVALSFTTLTLDSSIVDDPIDLVGGNGACAITYSRGSSTPVANGCDEFDTSADPQFVDPLTGDYHLQSASALIDVGNPADPGPGIVDFYGDPRMVQGRACDAVRRDIGADEFNPGSPPQCALDTYADTARPDDNGDCLSPATACKTIAAALAKSADNQTSFVADGTYAESLTLGQGRSLESLDPSDPRPIIDDPTDTSIRIDASGAGTISGLRIRSQSMPMLIQGPATVEDNVFDEQDVPAQGASDVTVTDGTGIVIRGNVFEDPDASGVQFGILTEEHAEDPEISNNTFTGLAAGVGIGLGQAEITGNQFSGAHPVGPTPFGNLPGAGIFVIGGSPTITGNTFGAPAQHPSAGIYVRSVPGAPDPAGATLSRNQISNNDAGVQVVDSGLPVTLSNDLIYGNTTGLESADSSADSPVQSTQGDVSATNATIFDNAVDVQLSYTNATLNSTIIGTPVDMVGNGACSISYSRGPSTPNGNGCGNFATSAAPQFVDAAGGDYHLQSTSELIDVGDPASPGGGVVDFYGGPRAVQGKACSSARRDIGADEYDPPTVPDCPPPPEPPAPARTADPPAAKIDKRPDKQSSDRSPTFDFSSDVAGSSFRCRLDNRAWKPCAPPVTYHGLRFGKHRFRVYAKGPTGVRGNTRGFRFAVIKGE